MPFYISHPRLLTSSTWFANTAAEAVRMSRVLKNAGVGRLRISDQTGSLYTLPQLARIAASKKKKKARARKASSDAMGSSRSLDS